MKTKISLLSMLLLFAISSVQAQNRSLVLESPDSKISFGVIWEGSGTITANGVSLLNDRWIKEVPVQNGKVTLSIPTNVELINFEVYGAKITNCTIVSHKKLRVVEFRTAFVGETKSLNILTITNCPELNYLNCSENKMTELIINGSPKIEFLLLNDNQLVNLNLNNNTKLKYLTIHNNKLVTLNLSGCSELINLTCQNNSLVTLNVNGCSKLNYLSCQNNNLYELNVSGFTKLDSLKCYNNHISTLNLTGCTNLKKIYANEQSTSVKASNGKNPISYINNNGLQTPTTINGAQYAPNDILPMNLGSVLSFSHPLPTGVTGDAFSGSLTITGYVQPPVTIAVTGVTVTPTTLSLFVGETGTVTSNITPANATIKDVSWTTGIAAVATVSPLGVVTAMSPGTSVIKVTTQNGNKTASCTVTVTAAPVVAVTGIAIEPQSLQLTVGGNMGSLTAIITPDNATNKNVTWSSSDETVALVSSSGIVAPLSPGNVIITVRSTDGNHTAFCMVNVAPAVNNDNIGSTSLTAYPNPTSGAVTVTGLTPGKAIRIYSITGALVGTYTAQVEEMTINLKNLSSGMYFLNFEGKTIRIVKN